MQAFYNGIFRIFSYLIVKNINGVNVKLSDVADVVLGPENEESSMKESGVLMLMLVIIPQSRVVSGTVR